MRLENRTGWSAVPQRYVFLARTEAWRLRYARPGMLRRGAVLARLVFGKAGPGLLN